MDDGWEDIDSVSILASESHACMHACVDSSLRILRGSNVSILWSKRSVTCAVLYDFVLPSLTWTTHDIQDAEKHAQNQSSQVIPTRQVHSSANIYLPSTFMRALRCKILSNVATILPQSTFHTTISSKNSHTWILSVYSPVQTYPPQANDDNKLPWVFGINDTICFKRDVIYVHHEVFIGVED